MNRVLYTLLQQQDEILVLVKAIHTRLPLPEGREAEEEIWLTKEEVMNLLFITKSTFYRRITEGKWTRKKSGSTWYYLKSSLINRE